MTSILPDLSPALENAIDSMGEPGGQPHEPARKRALVVGLDQQMEVVGLHREVHHAKPRTRRSPQRPPNFKEDHLLP
jgi:hypothetical protein